MVAHLMGFGNPGRNLIAIDEPFWALLIDRYLYLRYSEGSNSAVLLFMVPYG
jgi:hypothetical protein